MVSADSGESIELAEDDPGYKDGGEWSPDGKWISYNSDGTVKIRPEGEILEADLPKFYRIFAKEWNSGAPTLVGKILDKSRPLEHLWCCPKPQLFPENSIDKAKMEQ